MMASLPSIRSLSVTCMVAGSSSLEPHDENVSFCAPESDARINPSSRPDPNLETCDFDEVESVGRSVAPNYSGFVCRRLLHSLPDRGSASNRR